MAKEDNQEVETSLEDLEKSYGALIDQGNWEGDSPSGPDSTTDHSTTHHSPLTTPQAAEPPPEPQRIIEALLFVGGEPLTPARAGDIVRGLAPAQFHQAIANLNRDYRRQGRPYAIGVQGEGYVLTLRPCFRDVIDKLYGGVREARLSTAALDVLSLVAYRQPIGKQEIDSLRGAESGHLLRQLIRRGLVEIVHRGEGERRAFSTPTESATCTAGKEVTYGTTPRFLELFGLQNLDDLPRTQDLQQI